MRAGPLGEPTLPSLWLPRLGRKMISYAIALSKISPAFARRVFRPGAAWLRMLWVLDYIALDLTSNGTALCGAIR